MDAGASCQSVCLVSMEYSLQVHGVFGGVYPLPDRRLELRLGLVFSLRQLTNGILGKVLLIDVDSEVIGKRLQQRGVLDRSRLGYGSRTLNCS